VLIVSFIPILFVSVGYRFLNLADPDAGTTFRMDDEGRSGHRSGGSTAGRSSSPTSS